MANPNNLPRLQPNDRIRPTQARDPDQIKRGIVIQTEFQPFRLIRRLTTVMRGPARIIIRRTETSL